MKTRLTIAVVLLAVVTMGQATWEGLSVVRVTDFKGMNDFNLFTEDLSQGSYVKNFDVVLKGNSRILRMRQGYLSDWSSGETVKPNAAIVYGPGIHRIYIDKSGNIQSTQLGAFSNLIVPSSGNRTGNTRETSMVIFKDTLLIFGADTVSQVYNNVEVTGRKASFPYPKALLHQDRIYGVGRIGNDSAWANKLVWMPEFNTFLNRDTLAAAIADGRGGFAYIAQDDGDRVTTIISLEGNIVAFKSTSMYAVIVDPSTNAPSEIRLISSSFGTPWRKSVCEYGGSLYFLNTPVDGVYEYNGGQITRISDPVQSFFSDSGLTTAPWDDYSVAILNDRLFVTVPNSGNNNRTLVYDFISQSWTIYDFPWNFMITYDPILLNSVAGQPLQYFDGASNQDLVAPVLFGWCETHQDFDMYPYGTGGGGTIEAVYRSSFSSFGDLWSRKEIRTVGLAGQKKATAAATTITVQWLRDNVIGTPRTLKAFSVPAAAGQFLETNSAADSAQGVTLGYQIKVTDSGAVEIHGIELGIIQKGVGDKDD